jgi:hypothetical protein
MTAHEEKRIADETRIGKLLKAALPPVAADAEPARNLWSIVLRRLDAETASPRLLPRKLPWFDWALIAGLILFAIAFPATIPVFLYYL